MFLKKFVVGGLLSIALIAAFSFVPLGSKVGAEVYFSDKFVANLSEDEIRVIVEEKVAEFESQTVRIGKQAVTPVELGVTYNIDKTVSRLLKQKATLLASLTKADSTGLDIVEGEIVLPVIEYNYGELRMKIASILEEYETEPVDAAVVFGDNGYYVTESSLGRTIIGKDDLIEDIVDKLGKDLLELDEEKNYAVKYMAVSPRYNTEQAKVIFEKLGQVLSSPVKISIAGGLREISGASNQKWFDFDYEKGEIFLVNSEVESYVADFAKEFNQEASTITVKAINSYTSEYYGNNTYYKAEVDGVMKSGKSINQEKLVADIIDAFGSDEKVVYVEFEVAPMTVKSEVEGAYFDDMISVGKSSYALGNQPNRVHNIKTATAYQNAVVIPPGARFSFNDVGGWVTVDKGYQNGQIIMGTGLVNAPGGGVCQVSTTSFRAAINAGLDIDKRKNHSWDVTYYQDVHGVDAAVYPPGQVDLAYVNNTPGYILVHAFVNEPEETVYFEFYGTSDGRSVELSEPWLSRPVGGKTVKTNWRITKADGTVEEKEIVSSYWR